MQRRVGQPRRGLGVHSSLRHPEVRHDEDAVLDQSVHQRVIHLAVAYEMRETVDTRMHQLTGVLVVEDVRDHP